MASYVNTDNVSTSRDHPVNSVSKVKAVSADQDALQVGNNLPSDGQKLPADESKSPADSGSIEKAVDEMNDHARMLRRQLEFSVDKDSGRTVIKVLDSDTQDVIRQIPGEEALQYARMLKQNSELKIFDTFT